MHAHTSEVLKTFSENHLIEPSLSNAHVFLCFKLSNFQTIGTFKHSNIHSFIFQIADVFKLSKFQTLQTFKLSKIQTFKIPTNQTSTRSNASDFQAFKLSNLHFQHIGVFKLSKCQTLRTFNL